MVDSTSVRPVAWRWSRRVASFAVRGVLAAVSTVVLVYGAVQVGAVMLRAMLPAVSFPASMSPETGLAALETIPPVRLFGPIMIDPVLNTTSALTVAVSVGIVALGALGMTVAGTAPYLHRQTTKKGGLSAALPSVHDFFLFGKPRREVAQDAKLFSQQTAACIFVWWSATEIIIPMLADAGGIAILVLSKLFVPIIPVVGFICAILAVSHAIWYVGLRWKARSTTQDDADSSTTPLDSEPSADYDRGDSE